VGLAGVVVVELVRLARGFRNPRWNSRWYDFADCTY